MIDVVPKVKYDEIATGSQQQSHEIRRLQEAQRRLINGPDHPAVKRWAASQGDA